MSDQSVYEGTSPSQDGEPSYEDLKAEVERLTGDLAPIVHACCEDYTAQLIKERDEALAEVERLAAERDEAKRDAEGWKTELDIMTDVKNAISTELDLIRRTPR